MSYPDSTDGTEVNDLAPTAAHKASADELPLAARSLARAFAYDPIYLYVSGRSTEDFLPTAQGYFHADLREHLRSHKVIVSNDGMAASTWVAPNSGKTSVVAMARMVPGSIRFFGAQTPRAIRTLDHLEAMQPDEPHWYLGSIGVDPTAQGSGYGTTLMLLGLAACDAAEEPCYLETAKETNLPFYKRFGFSVIGTFRADSKERGPQMWQMWREPHGA